jgi:hypothetical protein
MHSSALPVSGVQRAGLLQSFFNPSSVLLQSFFNPSSILLQSSSILLQSFFNPSSILPPDRAHAGQRSTRAKRRGAEAARGEP